MFLTCHPNNSICYIMFHLSAWWLEWSVWSLNKSPKPLLSLFECRETFSRKSRKSVNVLNKHALWNSLKLFYPASMTMKSVTAWKWSGRAHSWRGKVFLKWLWSPNLCRHSQDFLTLLQNVSLHSNSDNRGVGALWRIQTDHSSHHALKWNIM